MNACESNQTERVEWIYRLGRRNLVPVEPGDFNGKDESLVLAPKHSYRTTCVEACSRLLLFVLCEHIVK